MAIRAAGSKATSMGEIESAPFYFFCQLEESRVARTRRLGQGRRLKFLFGWPLRPTNAVSTTTPLVTAEQLLRMTGSESASTEE